METREAAGRDPQHGGEIDLSIVVALVSGVPQHLRTCLTALEAQRIPRMEILVPYDDPVADVVDLSAEFPEVIFIRAEGLDTAAARAGASREHHDSIRTVGLRLARGRVVAMLEDIGRTDAGWCRGLLDALERHPKAGAVGGGMICGNPGALKRAVCMSDFWRYWLPLPETTSVFASDANIAYRRAALEEVGDAWEDDFRETTVNAALLERGHEIWLTPDAKIFQDRAGLTWSEALKERYVWGRSYGGNRVRGVSFARRLVYAAFCPALPLLFASRIVRITLERGGFWSRCLPVLPHTVFLFVVWSVGEAIGYLTGSPDGRSADDGGAGADPPPLSA